MAVQGLKIKCPRCKKFLNVSTSESKSLLSISAALVCCNPRCDGFRCNFLGEMIDLRLATFRPAPEAAMQGKPLVRCIRRPDPRPRLLRFWHWLRDVLAKKGNP